MNFASPHPSHEHAGRLIWNYVFPPTAVSKILEKKCQYVESEMMGFISSFYFPCAFSSFVHWACIIILQLRENTNFFSKGRQEKPPGLIMVWVRNLPPGQVDQTLKSRHGPRLFGKQVNLKMNPAPLLASRKESVIIYCPLDLPRQHLKPNKERLKCNRRFVPANQTVLRTSPLIPRW